ncbi:hypothetical protein GCM10007907_00250 [Chitinimonas prasina]|uniref:YCII-related domain-containing protein n=2 Tax=Chitinimonas prasina TaxID=1434937 RepID=A0ABQ5Y8H9_9NEIS|nr:hypothetical protein GCM10007907_00250 [Chitinimonas prasina]
MFLIDLVFTAPNDVVDKYVAAHRQYLSSHYDQGLFLLGGRKVPRTGGVILSRHNTLAEVEQIFNSDPLVLASAASYTVMEFELAMLSPELKALSFIQ